jgi:hypothetical protein
VIGRSVAACALRHAHGGHVVPRLLPLLSDVRARGRRPRRARARLGFRYARSPPPHRLAVAHESACASQGYATPGGDGWGRCPRPPAASRGPAPARSAPELGTGDHVRMPVERRQSADQVLPQFTQRSVVRGPVAGQPGAYVLSRTPTSQPCAADVSRLKRVPAVQRGEVPLGVTLDYGLVDCARGQVKGTRGPGYLVCFRRWATVGFRRRCSRRTGFCRSCTSTTHAARICKVRAVRRMTVCSATALQQRSGSGPAPGRCLARPWRRRRRTACTQRRTGTCIAAPTAHGTRTSRTLPETPEPVRTLSDAKFG